MSFANVSNRPQRRSDLDSKAVRAKPNGAADGESKASAKAARPVNARELQNEVRDVRNEIIDATNVPAKQAQLFEALDGQQMQERQLDESLQLEETFLSLKQNPIALPRIQVAPTASAADIKSGKASATALPEGTKGVFIKDKNMILIRPGLSKAERKLVIKEEVLEAVAAMAEKHGVKVASGDVGARMLKSLKGYDLEPSDYVARDSDVKLVRFEGQVVKGQARASDNSSQLKALTKILQSTLPISEASAPVNNMKSGDTSILIQLIIGDQPFTVANIAPLVRQGAVQVIDGKLSLNLRKLTPAQNVKIIKGIGQMNDNKLSFENFVVSMPTIQRDGGRSYQMATGMRLVEGLGLEEEVARDAEATGMREGKGSRADLTERFASGHLKFRGQRTALETRRSTTMKIAAHAMDVGSLLETTDDVGYPMIQWNGKSDASGSFLTRLIIGGGKMTLGRLKPLFDKGVLTVSTNGKPLKTYNKAQIKLDLSKLSTPAQVRMLENLAAMDTPSSVLAGDVGLDWKYKESARATWKSELRKGLGLADPTLKGTVATNYGGGKWSQQATISAFKDGALLFDGNKVKTTRSMATVRFDSALRPNEVKPAFMLVKVNLHDQQMHRKHVDSTKLEFKDPKTGKWETIISREYGWRTKPKKGLAEEGQWLLVPVGADGTPPEFKFTNTTIKLSSKLIPYKDSKEGWKFKSVNDAGASGTTDNKGLVTGLALGGGASAAIGVGGSAAAGATGIKVAAATGIALGTKVAVATSAAALIPGIGLAIAGVALTLGAIIAAFVRNPEAAIEQIGQSKTEWSDGGNWRSLVDRTSDGHKDYTLEHKIFYTEIPEPAVDANGKKVAPSLADVTRIVNRDLKGQPMDAFSVTNAMTSLGFTYDKSLTDTIGQDAGEMLVAMNRGKPLLATDLHRFIASRNIRARPDRTWSISALQMSGVQRAQIVKHTLMRTDWTETQKSTFFSKIMGKTRDGKGQTASGVRQHIARQLYGNPKAPLDIGKITTAQLATVIGQPRYAPTQYMDLTTPSASLAAAAGAGGQPPRKPGGGPNPVNEGSKPVKTVPERRPLSELTTVFARNPTNDQLEKVNLSKPRKDSQGALIADVYDLRGVRKPGILATKLPNRGWEFVVDMSAAAGGNDHKDKGDDYMNNLGGLVADMDTVLDQAGLDEKFSNSGINSSIDTINNNRWEAAVSSDLITGEDKNASAYGDLKKAIIIELKELVPFFRETDPDYFKENAKPIVNQVVNLLKQLSEKASDPRVAAVINSGADGSKDAMNTLDQALGQLETQLVNRFKEYIKLLQERQFPRKGPKKKDPKQPPRGPGGAGGSIPV